MKTTTSVGGRRLQMEHTYIQVGVSREDSGCKLENRELRVHELN